MTDPVVCKEGAACKRLLFNFEGADMKYPQVGLSRPVGDDCDEVPPVPMPNTEVKLIYAENTCLATGWEDR